LLSTKHCFIFQTKRGANGAKEEKANDSQAGPKKQGKNFKGIFLIHLQQLDLKYSLKK
jgi:hypothetical protein